MTYDTGLRAAFMGELNMFRVENADFIADKLAAELLPDQEYREATKNSVEAIHRRYVTEGSVKNGRIEFDVDWAMLANTGSWYVSCADNGDGMNRAELEKYMTTLAVRGANENQSLTGNQGMGLKISGPTRHKEGLLIRALKDGDATMIQVGWNRELRQYGLIPIGPDGQVVLSVAPEMFPAFIREQGSGTVVTFLGNDDARRTFLPVGRPKGWLFKYLNQRFYRFSDEKISLYVRVPVGDEDEWPRTRDEADERSRGQGSFNLNGVAGTGAVWDSASKKLGADYRGVVSVPGDPGRDVPAAKIHWWVLPTTGSDVSTRTYSGGSLGVLFQNEVHDWRVSSAANALFARLGVLFGKSRVAFVVEPLGSTVTSDFARAHVLIGGKPSFESDSWPTWADQFRERMPDKIKEVMVDEQSRLQADDPDRAKRIKERLKDVMALLRPVRYRRNADGSLRASGPSVTGPEDGTGIAVERPTGTSINRHSGGTRGIGSVLAQMDAEGEAASEVFSVLHLEPKWVTEAESSTLPIVNDDNHGLVDRAAALAGEDGATAPILLLNKEFRGYVAIVSALNDWANPEGDDDKAQRIETVAQEWIEQKMVEAVTGLRQLENGSSWTPTSFDDALSPVALTAAFMADRYHTMRETKRQIGAIRAATVATAAS